MDEPFRDGEGVEEGETPSSWNAEMRAKVEEEEKSDTTEHETDRKDMKETGSRRNSGRKQNDKAMHAACLPKGEEDKFDEIWARSNSNSDLLEEPLEFPSTVVVDHHQANKYSTSLTGENFLRALEAENQDLLSHFIYFQQQASTADPKQFQYDCFMSHLEQDTQRDLVAPLAETMQEIYGFHSFVDSDNNPKGDVKSPNENKDSSRTITALWTCRVVLVFLSREFHKSNRCLKELYTALYRRRDPSQDFIMRIVFCDGMDPGLCDSLPAYAGLDVGDTFGTLYRPYMTLEQFSVECMHPTMRQLLSGNDATIVPDGIFLQHWRRNCPLKPPLYLLESSGATNPTKTNTPTSALSVDIAHEESLSVRNPKDGLVSSQEYSSKPQQSKQLKEPMKDSSRGMTRSSTTLSRDDLEVASTPLQHDPTLSKKDIPKPQPATGFFTRRKVVVFGSVIGLVILVVASVAAVVTTRSPDTTTSSASKEEQVAPSPLPTTAPVASSSVPTPVSPSSPPTTPPPTPLPTSPPTQFMAPTTSPRIVQVVSFLQSVTLTTSILRYPVFGPSATLEEKALAWILDTDPAQLGVETDAEQRRLVQRYALATLWFLQNTTEALWEPDAQQGWLTAAHECDWAMITCEDVRYLEGIGNTIITERFVDTLGAVGKNIQGQPSNDLGLLTRLTELLLSENALTGPFPVGLTHLTALKVLELDQNEIQGPIPSQIGELTDLVELRAWSNLLSGRVPYSFRRLSKLTTLDLDDNEISGTFPSALTSLTNLRFLELDNNAFSGTIPDSFISPLSNLRLLELDGNQFSGPLPTTLSGLIQLNTLYLHDNRFTGSIPEDIGRLTNMIRLAFQQNRFTTFLPSSVGDMVKLTYLSCHSCRLSGSIPGTLSNLTDLNTLDLSLNDLTGTVFSGLSELSNLEVFSISRNPDLGGTIPSEIADFPQLTRLYAYATNISGDIPLCLNTNRTYEYIVADCEEVSCPCCTHCCPAFGDIPSFGNSNCL